MKPSTQLAELLGAGSTSGWHLHERNVAGRLIASECSSDLCDSYRNEIKFLHAETLLPAENVRAIARSIERDGGKNSPASFGHLATNDWGKLRGGSGSTAARPTARQPLHRTESHTRKTLASRLGAGEESIDLLLAARVLKPISQCGPNSWRFSSQEIQNIKELTAK